MYPYLPSDCIAGAAEMMCYVCTAATAVLSWLVACRY